MKKLVRIFLGAAVLPPLVLAMLALIGARHDVVVVLNGGGPNAGLGAAWVAAWLASVIGSPIAAGAALVSFGLSRHANYTVRLTEARAAPNEGD